jgi:hypothetical protein
VFLRTLDPPSWFFVSVADKGLSVFVSGLESMVAGDCACVDSKGVCRRFGDGSCGRSGGRRDRGWGQVAEWEVASTVGCWVELVVPRERIGLLGWD